MQTGGYLHLFVEDHRSCPRLHIACSATMAMRMTFGDPMGLQDTEIYTEPDLASRFRCWGLGFLMTSCPPCSWYFLMFSISDEKFVDEDRCAPVLYFGDCVLTFLCCTLIGYPVAIFLADCLSLFALGILLIKLMGRAREHFKARRDLEEGLLQPKDTPNTAAPDNAPVVSGEQSAAMDNGMGNASPTAAR